MSFEELYIVMVFLTSKNHFDLLDNSEIISTTYPMVVIPCHYLQNDEPNVLLCKDHIVVDHNIYT